MAPESPDERGRVLVAGDRGARPHGGWRVLAGTPARRRAAGLLPALERGVAQHAVRRVRPAPVEADREGGRVRARRPRARPCSSGCAALSAVATKRVPSIAPAAPARVRASDVLPDRQAARGDHRRRPRDVHDQADQLVQRSRRLDVPAGFDALRDQDVGAVRHRLPGAGRRADLHRHARARVVATGDALASGLPPRERQHRNAELPAARPVARRARTRARGWRRTGARELAHARDHAGELAGRRPGAGERAERARLAHGGDERRAGTASRSAPARARGRCRAHPAGRGRRRGSRTRL